MSDNPRELQFMDTNILIYAYDPSAGRKQAIAGALLKKCWENQNGCLSVQILQEFFVNITRKIQKPIEHLQARQIVADLSTWNTHVPGASDVLAAIDLLGAYKLSFWDAMIVQSALQTGCGQIWSEDLSHGGVYGGVRVLNPFIELASG